MIIYHCVPKAARRFLVRKLLRALPALHALEYYEPMQLETPQRNRNELSILFDPAGEKIRRFDYAQLRRIDFIFGVFSADRFRKEPGDYSFTFLRHPVDRFYSGFNHAHHYLTAGTEASQDGSKKVRYRERYPEMVELFSGSLKSYVDRFVGDGGKIRFDRNGTVYGPIDELFFFPKNLEVHDFVGVMEHMGASLAILNRDLGTNITDDGKVNEGPGGASKRYGEARLKKIFAEDIETFHRYQARFIQG